MIERENEAQLHTISTNFEVTMDASLFKYASIWHGFLWFHVQTCSTEVQDHESSICHGLDVKKYEESLREIFLRVWDLDLNFVANAGNS